MSGMVGRRRGGRESRFRMNTGQVEIHGHAYLYFDDNYSYFQGTVNTEEESNYSIFGEVTNESERAHQRHCPNPKSKLHPALFPPPPSTSSTGSSTPYESEDEDPDLDFDNEEESEGHLLENGHLPGSGSNNAINLLSAETEDGHSHKMTLTDHYTGLIYSFPSILVNRHPRNDDTLLLSCDPKAQIRFKTDAVYKGQKAAMVIQKSLGSSSLLGKNCIVYSGELDLNFSDDFLVTGRNWIL